MVAGYNQAWFLPLNGGTHYGHDLASDFDLAGVESTFGLLRAAGSRHIRLWLCEGNNKNPEGVSFKDLIANGLEDNFIQNIQAVMACAQRHEVVVYWTLLAPNTGYDAKASAAHLRGPLPEYRQLYTQLFDLQQHPYAAVSFIERVIFPLIEALSPYRDHVYGLDLVNEIDYVAATYLADEASRFPIIASWLDAVVRMVRSSFAQPPRLGVSFGYEHQRYPLLYHVDALGIGLDFWDIHAYDDAGRLSLQPDRPLQKPLVLGEFGHRSPRSPRADEPQRQADSCALFLANAAQHACEAAFAWRLLEDHRQHWSFYESQPEAGRLQVLALKPAAEHIRRWNAQNEVV